MKSEECTVIEFIVSNYFRMPPKSARGGKVINSVRKTTTKKSAAINVGTLTFDPPDVSKLPVHL